MLASQSVWYDDANPFHRLLKASQDGNLEQIRYLLDSGVNINRANETGLTALIVAAFANNAQSCKMLLENGAKIDQKDIGGYTALHLTTSIETTNVLLQYITDDNKKELINAKTKYGRTPLHEAALHGPAEKVLALLSNEALVDAEDSSGATSLHYTVSRSVSADITTIKAMITAGANVNKRNVYKQTPLAVACKHHQCMQKAIRIMIKAGADLGIQAIDGNTALHVLFFGNAIFEPQLTVAEVEEIVTANRKCLETVNVFGELPVHYAFSKCHSEEIIFRLLSYSSDSLDLSDALGRTILHLACEQNYLQILENYLGNSILANKTDCLGRSILHYGCRFSENGLSVKLILKSKAFNKFHQTDYFGFTAYQYARTRNTEIETKLLKVFNDHMETIIYMRNAELFKTRTDKPHRYSEIVKESKDLSMLLDNIVVKSNNSFPSNLRPVKSAEDYVRQIWMTCNTPLKNMENFSAQKRKVEGFMKKLIHYIAELDDRFSGTLVMRGSSYEGTIADERGDFDYVLVIDDLSSLCNVKEDKNDPPGFVQVRLLPDKDPGIFREFFDADG
ncbi:ANKRD28 [Mytilus coruscus]|uniref:ANKRD28 n=1 Tax=Mytilus coruscus TaxID=42192 RepID=A0A6J8BML4_MYTCO|nr:ANKRD28 [Mytilus coruscus]